MADLLSLHKEPNILPLDSFLVLSRNSPACNWSKMLCPWKRTHITQDEMRSYSSAQLIESIDQMEVLRELQKMDLSLSLSLSLSLCVCVCVCVCSWSPRPEAWLLSLDQVWPLIPKGPNGREKSGGEAGKELISAWPTLGRTVV
jgi:hypothetical protein